MLGHLAIARKLDTSKTQTLRSQQIFEDMIGTLLSTCPKRYSSDPILRRISIILNFGFSPGSPGPDGTPGGGRSQLYLVHRLRWEKLDRVIDALGWNSSAAAAVVAGTELWCGTCGIALHFLPPEWDVDAEAMDIVAARVSSWTRRVLTKE